MPFITFIKSKVNWLLTVPIEELSRAQRVLRYALDLCRYCARELYMDRATQMAAALTYHTLFSLLPTIVLMLVIMQVFVDEEQLQQFKTMAVDWTLQWLGEENAAESLATNETDTTSLQSDAEEPVADGSAGFETISKTLDENLQGYLDDLQKINFRGIGIVGVLLFIYGATGLLATIERGFNQIYGTSSSRQWYVRLPLYYTVITLGPLVLLAGQYFQARFLSILTAQVESQPIVSWITVPLVVLSPLLTTWLVLWLMYMLLPNTRVSVRAALIGSLVAAFGWAIGVDLFTFYVRGAASTTLYGALALLPLFLLWLWLTWLIVLFGLELTYTLHMMRGRKFKHLPESQERDMFVDPHWLIPMMGLVGQAFIAGKPARSDKMARQMSLPIRAVRELGQKLEKAGLLHRTDKGDTKDPGYALAMPAERITVVQILEVGAGMSLNQSNNHKLPGGDLLNKLAAAQQQTSASTTLADIVGRNE